MRQPTIYQVGGVSTTEQAEAFLRSKNPYLNGTYRKYLLSEQEYQAELQGYIADFERREVE